MILLYGFGGIILREDDAPASISSIHLALITMPHKQATRQRSFVQPTFRQQLNSRKLKRES
jgi:hypothetical protein